VSFRELPGLLVSGFVRGRGHFDRNDGPDRTPRAGRSIFVLLGLLLLLVVVTFQIADLFPHRGALQDCLAQGRPG
jgi:hypothetical protein